MAGCEQTGAGIEGLRRRDAAGSIGVRATTGAAGTALDLGTTQALGGLLEGHQGDTHLGLTGVDGGGGESERAGHTATA